MKINTQILKPLDLRQFILANLLISFIIMVVFIDRSFENLNAFMISYVWSFFICITQWLGPLLINNMLDKKITWDEQPLKRTFIGLLSLLAWSVAAFIVVQSIMFYIVHGVTPAEGWASISSSIIYTFLISLFISLVFTTIGFFKAWRQSVISEADLKSQMMAYKYESLRNQINPHFLFNSFNVLSDLVYSDQQQAVKFIRQMSELFHYVLDSRDKELVKLKEEVEFMNAYIYLLKTRFDDKLKLDINLIDDLDAYIVPMTLQLLVENAVKHNEVSEKYPLSIEIRRKGDYIEIENAIRPKQVGEISNKTGLKNISQQFSFFTDREIEVLSTTTSFTVRVPLIYNVEELKVASKAVSSNIT